MLTLDWSTTKKAIINNISYTEVKFVEGLNHEHDKGIKSSNSSVSTQIQFSLVFRKVSDKIESVIKYTIPNATLAFSDSVRKGTIESYHTFDGKVLDVWFTDFSTNKVMKRKEMQNQSFSNTSIRQLEQKIRSRNVNDPESLCYNTTESQYVYSCISLGASAAGDYNIECGWRYIGEVTSTFCFSGSGGTETWPPTSGGGNQTVPPTKTPCPGDVILNPIIAKSNATNINGGRFGPTRKYPNGQPKEHKGLDIYAKPNTPLYAIFSGVVTRSISIFQPQYYGSPTSFGNLVEIKSTLADGRVIKILYAHLNSTSLTVDDIIDQGQQIGLSGKTGNAQNVISPHVHIQVTENGQKKNPENFISTKYNQFGYSTGSPCN
ncbi:M23 family metallopeptidase [Sediminibacterium sp. C3]|uniref:M23 family metallopeptidase n=1 Tax=Sediminibacterium sp. C3 TaxID=1267211 RepID=UPI000414E006|nr:M23 family metallopeptidase [Sediminibacterium sp. C3]